jgi:hypothetical protein
MISAVSIMCVVAIVLTLVLILKLIFSFHEGDGVQRNTNRISEKKR